MLKKKLTCLFIAAAMLASAMPAALAADDDTTAETAAVTAAAPELPDGETPPELPDGETPPELPDGETPPELPDAVTYRTASLPFKDVASDAWYYDAVASAYSKGLIEGVTNTEFLPESNVTGAQLLTMLYRADGHKTSEQYEGNWYDEPVAWAKEGSILVRYGGWDFVPEDALTREQMMDVLYRFMMYKGVDVPTGTDLSVFSDSDQISEFANDAIVWLVSTGMIEGDGDTLRPLGNLNRAETATILVRTVNKLQEYNIQSIGIPQGTPPADGQAPSDEAPQGTPPADGQAPSGEAPQGTPPADGQAPSGEAPQGTPPSDGNGGPGGAPGGFGGSGTVTQGTSANTISEDGTYSKETYTSTGDDENALRVDGAKVTLNSVTVNKSAGASSNTEDGDFYGQNAALLATNGADVTIKNAAVTSSAQNGNGVFSYGEGTKVTISDSKITTTADNSGGIQTTGGGETNASNLTVTTSGQSAAAIRSDRGGGTVVADKGTYTSNGYNSPAIYSTADITVSNATLTANNSEALVIEGKNSITLNNSKVTGNMSDTQGSSSDENVHNVMIYQSMSGDADVGTSTFNMTGGSLTGNNGDMIYVTNTHSVINLSGVTINNKDTDAYLMRVTGNSAKRGWGTAGANGAQVEFTADAQTLKGDIVVDSVSTLDLTLKNKSALTGTINIIDNAEGGTAVENNAVVTIEKGSTWNLTGDCVITGLENNGKINFNGHTITLADGTVLSK